MLATEPRTKPTSKTTPADANLDEAIRSYVRTYVLRHGRTKAAQTFGVSRHTLWRCLRRGHLGLSLPRAVTKAVGHTPEAIEAATWAMTASRAIARRGAGPRHLTQHLEDTLLLLCATPLATVEELARFSRIPATTLRGRLAKLKKRGLADSVVHHLSDLGLTPRRRYFATELGIDAWATAENGRQRFLREYPVSREWFRLLGARLDAIAVLYHVASLVAKSDPAEKPMRVDHYRQGPYDLLIALSGGSSVGLLRQGLTLPSANLRYRLRTLEKLSYDEKPTTTLVLTHSDQATRRAFRTLGEPMKHHTTFVATQGELLAGDVQSKAWQQCGTGTATHMPEEISPDVTLSSILAWAGRLVEANAESRRSLGLDPDDRPTPDPDALYPAGVRATMPKPARELSSALSLRLTRAEKEVLDLLAAWPLCTTGQLAGLMGGVTRRRANQVLRSLTEHGLVRPDRQRHVLTDEGHKYLARRDRAAVGPVLARWSSRRRGRRYVGTSLRAMASQPKHHDAVTSLAAALAGESTRSRDCGVLDLLPTSRSAVGYWYNGTNYVIHPDISFTLTLGDDHRACFLEFERRATTPKRVRSRLQNYRRYFESGWARQDHGGQIPLVLFVFATPDDEEAFLQASARVNNAPFASSNLEVISRRGILGDTWRRPAPDTAERLPLHQLVKRELCR